MFYKFKNNACNMIKKINSLFCSEKGYTLVELLTVIVVMVVIGLIITTIIVSSLRGGSKTNAINEVRDAGNTAITRMSRAIEFSEGFVKVSSDSAIFADCLTSTIGNGSPHFKSVTIKAFDGGEITYSCESDKIASNSVVLVDDTKISAPSTSCYFTCSQAYLSQPPTIGINFVLIKGVDALFFEQKHMLDFHTSVVMRNLMQ
jgi:type II secretory pathway pseudopilin PulG